MKGLIAGSWLLSMLAGGAALAQPSPFNELGVTMGHWHIASRDVQANKKIFVAMGGAPLTGGNEAVQFPGVRVNLTLGNAPGTGETVGSVVNHVGFIVKNVQEQAAQWKAKGVPVLPGNNNRLDQAFVVTPIRHEHVHFLLSEAEIPKAKPGMRRPSVEKQAPATTPRLWISRAASCGLPRLTLRRLPLKGACSTTSAST